MKKLLISSFIFLLFVTPVYAVSIVSEYSVNPGKNDRINLAPIRITSISDGDITAEHGIRFLLDPEPALPILFHEQTLAYLGSAIDNGRIDLNAGASFSADYKSVFIPVKEDFKADEWLDVNGLALRTYKQEFGSRFIGLDLNGDFTADVSDINEYKVRGTAKVDYYPPYPIKNPEYLIHADGSLTLTWNTPNDYDYDATIINRTRIKGGQPALASVYKGFLGKFTDTDLKDVTFVSYSIVATDADGNWSEPVVVEVDLTVPMQENPVEEDTQEEAEDEENPSETPEAPQSSESETEELSRLLNYYNIRYSIKCLPSGVPVPTNNSACLWAKIDLIYAQEVTGSSVVENLVLSDRDLELMATRRKWPTARHENNCVLSEKPANYCSALGKALNRIGYFLD